MPQIYLYPVRAQLGGSELRHQVRQRIGAIRATPALPTLPPAQYLSLGTGS